ncbi:uncharacterized protein LOC119111999 [Pollicipes pollicipes]|uniref:uncharacterized protein LOC119111999 n=1 Tax=Pollicipes pollicipes TaxID=41117 RepID=UPI0018856D9E|nr:uncharacterized protein LOC119111999 [Pollicipes pollicipes]
MGFYFLQPNGEIYEFPPRKDALLQTGQPEAPTTRGEDLQSPPEIKADSSSNLSGAARTGKHQIDVLEEVDKFSRELSAILGESTLQGDGEAPREGGRGGLWNADPPAKARVLSGDFEDGEPARATTDGLRRGQDEAMLELLEPHPRDRAAESPESRPYFRGHSTRSPEEAAREVTRQDSVEQMLDIFKERSKQALPYKEVRPGAAAVTDSWEDSEDEERRVVSNISVREQFHELLDAPGSEVKTVSVVDSSSAARSRQVVMDQRFGLVVSRSATNDWDDEEERPSPPRVEHELQSLTGASPGGDGVDMGASPTHIVHPLDLDDLVDPAGPERDVSIRKTSEERHVEMAHHQSASATARGDESGARSSRASQQRRFGEERGVKRSRSPHGFSGEIKSRRLLSPHRSTRERGDCHSASRGRSRDRENVHSARVRSRDKFSSSHSPHRKPREREGRPHSSQRRSRDRERSLESRSLRPRDKSPRPRRPHDDVHKGLANRLLDLTGGAGPRARPRSLENTTSPHSRHSPTHRQRHRDEVGRCGGRDGLGRTRPDRDGLERVRPDRDGLERMWSDRDGVERVRPDRDGLERVRSDRDGLERVRSDCDSPERTHLDRHRYDQPLPTRDRSAHRDDRQRRQRWDGTIRTDKYHWSKSEADDPLPDFKVVDEVAASDEENVVQVSEDVPSDDSIDEAECDNTYLPHEDIADNPMEQDASQKRKMLTRRKQIKVMRQMHTDTFTDIPMQTPPKSRSTKCREMFYEGEEAPNVSRVVVIADETMRNLHLHDKFDHRIRFYCLPKRSLRELVDVANVELSRSRKPVFLLICGGGDGVYQNKTGDMSRSFDVIRRTLQSLSARVKNHSRNSRVSIARVPPRVSRGDVVKYAKQVNMLIDETNAKNCVDSANFTWTVFVNQVFRQDFFLAGGQLPVPMIEKMWYELVLAVVLPILDEKIDEGMGEGHTQQASAGAEVGPADSGETEAVSGVIEEESVGSSSGRAGDCIGRKMTGGAKAKPVIDSESKVVGVTNEDKSETGAKDRRKTAKSSSEEGHIGRSK